MKRLMVILAAIGLIAASAFAVDNCCGAGSDCCDKVCCKKQ